MNGLWRWFLRTLTIQGERSINLNAENGAHIHLHLEKEPDQTLSKGSLSIQTSISDISPSLEDDFYPRLCGGTFVRILLRHGKFHRSMGARASTMFFTDLTRLLDSEYKPSDSDDAFRRYIHLYQDCKIKSSYFASARGKSLKLAFDKIIRQNYDDALFNMNAFVARHLDNLPTNSKRRLIYLLVKLIEADKSIRNDEQFYVQNLGGYLTKNEIISSRRFSLQPFLLGILHYIVIHRPDNLVGRETCLLWDDDYVIPWGGEDRNELLHKYPRIIVESYESAQFNSSGAMVKSVNFANTLNHDIVDACKVYFENLKKRYSTLKTLLYIDEPKPFQDFYVCNDILFSLGIEDSSRNKREEFHRRVNMTTFSMIGTFSKYIIITGTGGIGKSMMMRHLLLDSIKHYNENRLVPFYVSLKNFSPTFKSLADYILTRVELFGGINAKIFNFLISNGDAVFLFDGLDEINSEYIDLFQNYLDDFITQYSQNVFIMSSRPYQNFLAYKPFRIVTLAPFRVEQSLELIDKLNFREDNPDIKKAFRKQLETNFVHTHKEFVENPLLLTIMLLSFEQFAEIPSQVHIFYKEAFETLAQKHDASKGAYKRQFSSGLTTQRFADYLAEFCMRTYCEKRFEFTKSEFEEDFLSLKERTRISNEKVEVDQFLDDLQVRLCLLYYEDAKYHFIHRSFQEYFCALFFSKQKDKGFRKIGNFFETYQNSSVDDKTFDMFYDMCPSKVEESIFKPYLTELFEECDKKDGYWTYLEKVYKIINYNYGNVCRESLNHPISFLTNFILTSILNVSNSGINNLPLYKKFVVATYVLIADGNHVELIESTKVNREECRWIAGSEGYNLSSPIADILADKTKYKSILRKLSEETCPLKIGYHKLRDYCAKLSMKFSPDKEEKKKFVDSFD